jgi:hypothetical protein
MRVIVSERRRRERVVCETADEGLARIIASVHASAASKGTIVFVEADDGELVAAEVAARAHRFKGVARKARPRQLDLLEWRPPLGI